MNNTITVPARHRLAGQVAGRIRQWQRRLADHLQAGDTFARQAGWTITPTGFGGRIYRDPRFSQLTPTHAPESPHQTIPPAMGPAPAATSRPPAARHAWRRRGRN